MVLKILQTLVVITSLNYSTDIVPNIPQGNNTTEIKNIQDDDINKVQDNNSKGNTIHHRCKHQLSVTWEGISLFGIGGIFFASLRNGGLGLLPYTLRCNFQYTYWFNNHIGLTSKASYGNTYINLINGDGCLSILQLGLGIRFSYNGRIGNNSTFYSGKIMIDAMFGNSISLVNVDGIEVPKLIVPQLNKIGLSVGLTPFEMVTSSGFTLGIDFLCLDIGFLLYGHRNTSIPPVEKSIWRKFIEINILSYFKIFLGKSWFI